MYCVCVLVVDVVAALKLVTPIKMIFTTLLEIAQTVTAANVTVT